MTTVLACERTIGPDWARLDSLVDPAVDPPVESVGPLGEVALVPLFDVPTQPWSNNPTTNPANSLEPPVPTPSDYRVEPACLIEETGSSCYQSLSFQPATTPHPPPSQAELRWPCLFNQLTLLPLTSMA